MPRGTLQAIICVVMLAAGTTAETLEQLKVHLSLGHRAVKAAPFSIRLVPSGGVSVESSDAWKASAGGGHTEDRTFVLSYPNSDVRPLQNLQVIWADLIAHSDADTVRRLTQDPAWRIDSRKVTFEMNAEGTRGFSLTLDQLLRNKAFWIPSLDLYIAAGDEPVSFADHQRQLTPYSGRRVLDQVRLAPEASYRQFKDLWEDMGNPNYAHPAQQGPGHIVCLSWDSAIAKFGIDRGGGVWNDYGDPDRFRFWFEFSNVAEGIGRYWKKQTLADGLPVITTVLERAGVRYEIEQFAYPLNGPPKQRSGDLNMVLMQRVKLTDLLGQARAVPVTLVHERRFASQEDTGVIAEQEGDRLLLLDAVHRNILLAVRGAGASVAWAGTHESEQQMKRLDITFPVDLPAGGSREFFVTLPSPVVSGAARQSLLDLDYNAARSRTLGFWRDYLERGAQFSVPEKAVNDLFRANLWHALRLPRRHDDGTIDLPYSNFAYDQTGTPWPVNQAVYVDYMLYGLRGYNGIASEEMEAIYRNNQESNGHVNGLAHWLVYTPGMLYAVAQDFLLSGDRRSFDKLLPETLKALDWTMEQIRSAAGDPGSTRGIVAGPLNDLTGSGYWAFNQAYLYAGLDLMGKALARAGHPRAAECRRTADELRIAIERTFGAAAVRSPLVQLRDHTWIPYVPCEATKYGRIYEQWYPTDVDTGAVHLLRLKALPAGGDLAESLLNDHEDNLFLGGLGMANEPVYNQQATAYLLRDDAKATIRAFYSQMASAFSQSVFEPVEHRWRWGQYFGPPSTDGAWFEVYRNMLVRELDDETLMLCQATPRRWLEDGKRIEVKRAPTWFGNISFEIQSSARSGSIRASFQLDGRQSVKSVFVRLRHPEGLPMRHVTVNGEEWRDFDPAKEWVRIPNPGGRAFAVVAAY
jgi:hypothetical protein